MGPSWNGRYSLGRNVHTTNRKWRIRNAVRALIEKQTKHVAEMSLSKQRQWNSEYRRHCRYRNNTSVSILNTVYFSTNRGDERVNLRGSDSHRIFSWAWDSTVYRLSFLILWRSFQNIIGVNIDLFSISNRHLNATWPIRGRSPDDQMNAKRNSLSDGVNKICWFRSYFLSSKSINISSKTDFIKKIHFNYKGNRYISFCWYL